MAERDETKERGNRPVETLRDGALKLAIFRNRHERGDTYSMVPGRIYTDEKSGEVREASSLSGSEALRMAHLLTKGHDKVNELKGKRLEQKKDAGRDHDTDRER